MIVRGWRYLPFDSFVGSVTSDNEFRTAPASIESGILSIQMCEGEPALSLVSGRR